MAEKIFSTDGRYSVEFIANGKDAEYGYMAVACIEDGQSYGGSSYWFTIGHYKSIKTAMRWVRKAMAAHNIELAA